MASGWHAGHRDAVLSYWASSWLTRGSLGRRAEDRFRQGFCDHDAASFEQCVVPPLATSTACAHRPFRHADPSRPPGRAIHRQYRATVLQPAPRRQACQAGSSTALRP